MLSRVQLPYPSVLVDDSVDEGCITGVSDEVEGERIEIVQASWGSIRCVDIAVAVVTEKKGWPETVQENDVSRRVAL